MRLIRKLLLTPTGLAFAVVQWVVVAFAIFNDEPEPGFGNSTSLLEYLYIFNLPALYIAGIFWELFTRIAPAFFISVFTTSAVAAIFISFQWLLFGSAVGLVVREFNAERNESNELRLESTDK